jgi:hypothetical protein
MHFWEVVTLLLYFSYIPRLSAILVSSDDHETEVERLVFYTAFLFPDQSSFEDAVKDPSWHRYDKNDPSSYWSTGKQDTSNLNATVATYAYTANTLQRRGGDDDKKKKHAYLGILGIIPGGAGLYYIGQKVYKLKHAEPTGVNVATPFNPANPVDPNVLKPEPLADIITHGTPLSPGEIPGAPLELIKPFKLPKGPPLEINFVEPPQALHLITLT